MSLKQSIVVVNEYTVKTGKKAGSRGGSPGAYVLRYMARNQATEDVTPVRLYEADSYITRYMARKEASETLYSVPEIKTAVADDIRIEESDPFIVKAVAPVQTNAPAAVSYEEAEFKTEVPL